MIRTIVKRSGKQEPFSPNKVNGWGTWAAKTLGTQVDWGSVVLEAVSQCPEVCDSLQLQETLISVCLSRKSWEYNRMAGRLYSALLERLHYPDGRPTVQQLHAELFEAGLMVKLKYSVAEYAEVEGIIDHKRDLKYPHYQINQIRFKYALRNRNTKKEYETPQFVYMRMAMALAENLPVETRLEHVRGWYEHFSNNRLNPPTPNFVNLGTKLNGYASCCLYTTDDTWQSLAAGDHIAYAMTCMSAGIGTHIKTRSIGDSVRGGLIQHQGKLPYYRAMVGMIGANLQNGRGGAATVYYTAYDPEVEVIQKLRHPMTPQSKRIAGCHYSFGSNKVFARKVARNEKYAPFSYAEAPELYEAQYGPSEEFERLYNEWESKATVFLNARDVFLGAAEQSYETGVQYLHMTDALNTHTPFKDKIYLSNLCVTGDTLITVADVFGAIDTITIEEFCAKNDGTWRVKTSDSVGNEGFFKILAAAQTGNATELIEIEDEVSGRKIRCTPEHKVLTKSRGWVEAHHLLPDDELVLEKASSTSPIKITKIYLDEEVPVYDLTVEDAHSFYANGVVVHNCGEIRIPVKPFRDVSELYTDYQEGNGEIGLCSLAGIIVSNIESDAQYADVAYYALKMIDVCIHKSDYVFPNLAHTAKARLSAGVGILGLAHLMAKEGQEYDTQKGRNFIHTLAETHMWHLINASLRLGKELGNAPWMHKTKWPEGWLPIDTYEKKVDELVTVGNKRDWESLRVQIIENGGIRNSVLSAFMPGESSTQGSGTTNGVYPIRDLNIMKTNDTQVNHWAAPDGTKLRKNYQRAWDISTTDMIKVYSIIQKWTDQTISADLFVKIQGAQKISSTEIIQDYLDMVKYGMITRYYVNSLTSEGTDLEFVENAVSEVIDKPEDEYCESCAL